MPSIPSGPPPTDALYRAMTLDGTDALEGTIFVGRYRIERAIGSGGMGDVYRAWHLERQIPVAIKVLRPYRTGNKDRLRFLREARIAARIDHPNVVRVLDYGLAGTRAYCVMEYLRGQSLAAAMCQAAPVPWSMARTILAQAIEGLRAVHELGVLHRDIKPANLFLAMPHDGDVPVVKVLDFGIAKAVDPASSMAHDLTLDDEVIGTPRYLAPERACGEPASASSDVYSLGVVAFELLTGRSPLAARNMVTLLRRRMTEPPPSARALVATLPPALDAVIRQAMEPDPTRRFQSLEGLGAALAAIPASVADSRDCAERRGPPPPDAVAATDMVTHELARTASLSPVGAPVGAPVGTPTGVPVGAPVGAPVGTPTGVPVGAPVGTPTGVPLTARGW